MAYKVVCSECGELGVFIEEEAQKVNTTAYAAARTTKMEHRDAGHSVTLIDGEWDEWSQEFVPDENEE